MNTHDLKNNLTTTVRSHRFKKVLICLLLGFFAVLIFGVGMHVGFMQASYNYQSGDNYYRSFGPGPADRRFGSFFPGVSESHGVSGKIISMNLPNIVVGNADNTEKTITIDDDTQIKKFRDTITSKDLILGDYVLIIGEPTKDTAVIQAKLIRVFPKPITQVPPPPIQPVNPTTNIN